MDQAVAAMPEFGGVVRGGHVCASKHCGRNASAVRKEQVSRELDEELNGFLEMAVEEKVKQG